MERPDSSRDLVPVPIPVHPLESGRTLRDIAAVVFRRRRVMAAVFVSVFASAGLGAVARRRWLDPPRWTSDMKFMVRRDRADAPVTVTERPAPPPAVPVSPQEVLAEIELLKSSDVIERLAREANAPAERLRRGLTAEPVAAGRNATNLIAVRYASPDREEVVKVLNKLPEAYLEKHLSVHRRTGVAEYFRSQAEAAEQELRQAEQELAEFEKQAPAVSEADVLDWRRKLAEVERLRTETDAALRQAEARNAELERQQSSFPASKGRAGGGNEALPLERLRAQLLELEDRRSEATRWREIRELEARIEQVRRSIAAETREPAPAPGPGPVREALEAEARRVRVEIAGLRAKRSVLAEEDRRLRERAAAAQRVRAETAVALAERTRKVRAAEENFLLYRKKYVEAHAAELLDQNRVVNVTVAERPRAPQREQRRSLRFHLALAATLAAAAALAGGFTAELTDHSVHTPRQLESYTAAAVLACIPEAKRG